MREARDATISHPIMKRLSYRQQDAHEMYTLLVKDTKTVLGLVAYRIHCVDCAYASVPISHSTFTSLSLTMPNSTDSEFTVEDLLESYIEPEVSSRLLLIRLIINTRK